MQMIMILFKKAKPKNKQKTYEYNVQAVCFYFFLIKFIIVY